MSYLTGRMKGSLLTHDEHDDTLDYLKNNKSDVGHTHDAGEIVGLGPLADLTGDTADGLAAATTAGIDLLTAATVQAQRTGLNVYAYYTREELVTARAAGFIGHPGTSISVDGVAYSWVSGCEVIPDLDDLLPIGNWTPSHFGTVDTTGETDGWAAWAAMIDAVEAYGKPVSIKPRAGSYVVTWDGATGEVPWSGGSATQINCRFSFLVQGVNDLILDFTDCKVFIGGTQESEWATLFRFRDCTNLRIIGGTFDFKHLPYCQGVITARNAGTGTNGTITFTLDSACPAPSFTAVRNILPFDFRARPQDAGIIRDSYTASALTLTDLGGGSYQIGGLTSAETSSTAWTGYLTVGSSIAAICARDGTDWFQFFNCNGVSMLNNTVHAIVSGFAEAHLGRDFVITGLINLPHDDLFLGCNRDPIELFSVGGMNIVQGCHIRGTGDDAVALGSPTITNLTYVSGTSFTGMMLGHYWQTTLSGNEYLTLRTPDGVYQATLHLSGAPTSASGYLRTFDFTVTAGSVPSPLTNYYCEVNDWGTGRALVSGNRLEKVRGRGIYAGQGGNYSDNNISDTTDQGIMIAIAITGGNLSVTRADGLVIATNTLTRTCRRTYYAGAIYIQSVQNGSYSSGLAETATGFQINNVTVIGNIVEDTPNAALLLGNVNGALVIGNTFRTIGATGAGFPFDTSLGQNCVISVINCNDVIIGPNVVQGINSRTIVLQETDNGGSNTNVQVMGIWNADASAFMTGFGTTNPSEFIHLYKAGVNLALMVEATSSFIAGIKLKNANWGAHVYAGDNGLNFYDLTNAVNRWVMSTSGHIVPVANNSYDLGSPTSRLNNVYERTNWLANGITAPSATTGVAGMFIETANGPPKLIYPDGTIKTFTVT